MKLYGTFTEGALLDALVWRSRSRPGVSLAYGICLPLGRRCVMVVVRFRPKRRVYVSLPYMHREDAIAAAFKRHDKRIERTHA